MVTVSATPRRLGSKPCELLTPPSRPLPPGDVHYGDLVAADTTVVQNGVVKGVSDPKGSVFIA